VIVNERFWTVASDLGWRVLIAALTLVVGYYLARLLRNLVRALLHRPRVHAQLTPTIVRLVSDAVFYVLVILAVGGALLTLGIPGELLLSGSTAVVVVLGLAMQQSLANLAATIIFLVFRPFHADELIETMGKTGTVEEIQLFNTVLIDGNGRLISLPNSKIQESGIVNYSRIGTLRTELTVIVGYGQEIGSVRAVLLELLTADAQVLAEPPPTVTVQELALDGVRLSVQASVRAQDYWGLLADLRERIKTRFDAEQIAFAQPGQ
jgi:small conductance mechanosensitive channel